MSNILVPIDGSDPGSRALEFAIRLSRGRSDAAIHALYVHPAIDVSGKIQIYLTLERMRQMAAESALLICRMARIPRHFF
jgi:nucleotide-binding universal stress UspA family protein